MLAARLYGPNDLRIEEVTAPEPGPGELVVRVRAAAICGTDLRAFKNGLASTGPTPPRILGHEVAGEVAATGPGVTGFELGQRVTIAPNIGCGHCAFCVSGRVHMCPSLTAIGIQVDGGFAEYVRIPAEGVLHGNVIPLPDGVSFAEAALVEPLACCYNSFEVLRPAPGEYVMIYGAGPIGIFHLLLARMVSPAKIILADPLPQRLASAEAFCPDVVVDPSRPDLGDLLMVETGGHGVDVTIVACPSPQAQADALVNAATFGRISLFGGLPAEREIVPLNANAIHYKQLTVTGTTRSNTAHYVRALNLVASGRIATGALVTGEYALRDALSAFAEAAAGRGLKTLFLA
ncbi:MAG: alcohol dehydrogenase catalytic domain-containing protein [Chitinophagales bacterium]